MFISLKNNTCTLHYTYSSQPVNQSNIKDRSVTLAFGCSSSKTFEGKNESFLEIEIIVKEIGIPIRQLLAS
jgi:hypothetical protein